MTLPGLARTTLRTATKKINNFSSTAPKNVVSSVTSAYNDVKDTITPPPTVPVSTPIPATKTSSMVVEKPSTTITTPTVNNTFGDYSGASVAKPATTGLQATTPTPSNFDVSNITFGDSARAYTETSPEYLNQRNDYLAQDLYNQGIKTSSQIYDYLSNKYSDFSVSKSADKENTAYALANRIGQLDAQKKQAEAQATGQQPGDDYLAQLNATTDRQIQSDQQSYLQDVQRAGTVGLDRPAQDLEQQKTLQMKALDRSIEQTRFSINNQIDDVAREADKSINLGEKIGALKGFNRSGGYIQGIQNIRDDADRTIGRLQQQLAMAEQYTGEDKAQVMANFQKEMTRAKEDFQYQMRDIMSLATIETDTLINKYGLSSDKLKDNLDKITLDVLAKREDLIGKYIQNSRSTIAMANDQLSVMENYDTWLNQSRERFTNIINADGGAALAGMSYKDIDNATKEGYLAPEQAQAYKQLMVGKAINSLRELGVPTQGDIDQLMGMIQGGISPSAAIMNIANANKDRYMQTKQQEWNQVSGMPGAFFTTGPDGKLQFQNLGYSNTKIPQQKQSTQTGYQGPTIAPANIDRMQESFNKYSTIADGSQVRKGQCGEFVNDYLSGMGVAMKFIDPIDVRALQTNSKEPSVGSVVVMDSSGSDLATKYGHVAIVTRVNEDGTFEIKEQNGKVPLKVGTRTLNVNDANIRGYFDPRLWLSAGQQQEDITSQLSNVAREAYNSKSITGTPSAQTRVKEELANAGVFDMGEGNSVFYASKPSEKKELASFSAGKRSWDQAYRLYKKLEAEGTNPAGWFDSSVEGARRFTGGGNPDVTNLNRILQKELSSYMKDISGATVPKEEVQRLSQQIPNINKMGNDEFAEAMESYNKSMTNSMNNIVTTYGFTDEDTFANVMYGGQVAGTQPQPQPQPTQTEGQLYTPIPGISTVDSVKQRLQSLGHLVK